jgi:hypothetical protein
MQAIVGAVAWISYAVTWYMLRRLRANRKKCPMVPYGPPCSYGVGAPGLPQSDEQTRMAGHHAECMHSGKHAQNMPRGEPYIAAADGIKTDAAATIHHA